MAKWVLLRLAPTLLVFYVLAVGVPTLTLLAGVPHDLAVVISIVVTVGGTAAVAAFLLGRDDKRPMDGSSKEETD